jgi:hypothetical protein
MKCVAPTDIQRNGREEIHPWTEAKFIIDASQQARARQHRDQCVATGYVAIWACESFESTHQQRS